MFRAKTILVIGAGASAEFGFPLGGALLKDIAKRVDISYDFGQLKRGDHVVAEALRSALNAKADVTSYFGTTTTSGYMRWNVPNLSRKSGER